MGKITQQPTNTSVMSSDQNYQARAIVLANSNNKWTPLAPQTCAPATANQLTFLPLNIGIVKGFLIKVSGSLLNSGGGAVATRTQFGAANILSQIVFTDTLQNIRVQTAGWHLSMIDSAKNPYTFGGKYVPNLYPIAYGNNFTTISAPATIANGVTSAVQMYYWLPLAYSPTDLRGAMFANVVQTQANIQVTINSSPFVAAGDATLGVYSGAAGSWSGVVTVSIWQNYLDDLPTMDKDSKDPSKGKTYILPLLDLQITYEIKNAINANPLVVAQDCLVPYTNFRTFLSTIIVYNNAGVLNAGTDVNYFALQAANTTQLWKYGPQEAALFADAVFMADPPLGTYYFNHRDAPINTIASGNMALVVNPSAVTAGAALLVGYESFGQQQQLSYGPSLGQ